MLDDGTGIGSIDMVAVWAIVLTAIAGGLALLWRILRAVVRVANRIDQMWDDWHGVPANPTKGEPGKPGVVYRLGSLETRMDTAEKRLPAA